jgi:membrane protein DedA with SNARE-associated domain
MVIPLVIRGVLLGVLLGVILGYGIARRWQLRARKKRDMDRLIAQFHALFRQIDQEK